MDRELSIVVPVFNEEANILPLTREIQSVFIGAGYDYELVFVDDGSSDNTWEKIRLAREIDPHVRGLRHERNAGQSAALWSGIQSSQSPLIATLDGDLQNDPADLPRLLAEMEHCDLVSGVRVKRQDNWLRRFSSRVARRARRAVLKVDFRDTGCAVRVLRRSVVKSFFPFNGLHRFMPVLAHAAGARTKELPINHRARVAGVSKYGIHNRLWRGIADLLAIAWYQRRVLGEVCYSELEEKRQAA